MAKPTDITVRILTEIRDEIRQSNVRLDKVEEALLELATQQRFIVRHVTRRT